MVRAVRAWPGNVYETSVVEGIIQGELDSSADDPLLLECMGEL
jgi:hypothetical protein